MSEHIRSVLEKHISSDSNLNLHHYIAMRRRSDWGKYAGEWCRENMSDNHWDMMSTWINAKMADHQYQD